MQRSRKTGQGNGINSSELIWKTEDLWHFYRGEERDTRRVNYGK
jgi:hypothetical protein